MSCGTRTLLPPLLPYMFDNQLLRAPVSVCLYFEYAFSLELGCPLNVVLSCFIANFPPAMKGEAMTNSEEHGYYVNCVLPRIVMPSSPGSDTVDLSSADNFSAVTINIGRKSPSPRRIMFPTACHGALT